MSGPVPDHIKALFERRKRGESLRPAAPEEEPDHPVRDVEIVAQMVGHSRVVIDGEEFKGLLDCTVEFGIDKPTVVTLSFYANVRSRSDSTK
jgi:hypothetical protein